MLKSTKPGEIAIVGYGCRLPGASDADGFWSLLKDGRCSVGQVDPSRWATDRWRNPAGGPGRSYTFAAGQLDAPFDFDAGFFGISPREAEQMDPQQRLMLQVTWEALEKSGLRASDLPKATTGVFVGASSSDYANRFYYDPAGIDSQFMTGNTLSLISNRVSYILDLNGPSYTVDTACSSGLYALHEAFVAMQAGLVDTAIVGAVNMLLSPFPFVGFSAATMLSKVGLCQAFDANGDGYVRSEGAVVFVLRTLESAIANNDRVLGVISGAGINSDGRTTGVSLPSGDQQRALLDDVYQRFNINPAKLAFIEAHGTGTRAGDPIETWALGQALGQRRADPLPIGSAKTNVGHLEAGSGLVGLLKAQLALEHGMLPASLHFNEPNPDIKFEDWNLSVAASAMPLVTQGAPLYAGVNSFGFGGANAHVVLRQPKAEERRPEPGKIEPAPLILSARSEESLTALARAYRARLDGASAAEAARVSNAAAYQRERLPHRLIALSGDRNEQIAALDAHLAGEKSPMLATGRAQSKEGRTAFVFSGNGAQHVGMGRAAYANDPIFRATFDAVSTIFEKLADVSLVEAMHADDLEERLPYTSLAQPLIFATQVATVESLAEKGLKPDAVLGHSVGEVAAAWAAGAFDLPDAVRLIHVRSRNQEKIRDRGTMAAVLAGEDATRAAIEEGGFDQIAVAADNSPRSVTISGPSDQIAAFAKFARRKKIACKALGLEYPFHSPIAEALKDDLLGDLDWLRPAETRCDFVSATFGAPADGEALGPHYWWSNIRQPVLFRQGLEALLEADCVTFVEIGPRPVLSTYVRDTAADRSRPSAVLTTLEEKDPRADMRRVVALAVAQGAQLVENRFFGRDARPDQDLPLYPWRLQTYFLPPSDEAVRQLDAVGGDPLLGTALRAGGRDWRATVDPGSPAWLGDHRVEDAVVFPAAGYVDMALAAGIEALAGDGRDDGPIELVDLDILRPLAMEEGTGYELRTTVQGDRMVVDVESRRRLSGEEFGLHARGRLRRPAGPVPAPKAPPAPDAERTVGAERLYELTRRFGLGYGEVFRRAVSARIVDDRSAFVTLDAAHPALDCTRHALHPALLDAAFHGLFALIAERAKSADGSMSYLPVRLGSLILHAPHAAPVGAWVEIDRASERSLEATFRLCDATGAPIATLTGARFKGVRISRVKPAAELTYRNALARIAPAGGAKSDLGALAPGLLREIAVDEAPELSAGALLLDTTARRVARDALAHLATESTVLDAEALIAEGRLAETARPLFERLLMALEEDEAVGRTEDGRALLDPNPPYPPLSALVEALFAEAPRRIVEIARLMALPDALPRLLAAGPSEGADGPVTAAQLRMAASGPAGEARWSALSEAAAITVANARPDRRLDVLVVGAAPAALLDRLQAAAVVSACVVTDPDPRHVRSLKVGDPDRAKIDYLPLDEILPGRSFDLVLAGDALCRLGAPALADLKALMAEGAALVAVEEAPSLIADLIEGDETAWWSDTLDPTLPVGRLREAPEWSETLAQAGFLDVSARPLASAEAQAALVLATAPARLPAEAETADGPILVVHAAAEKALAEALVARLAEAGRETAAVTEAKLSAALEASEAAEIVLLAHLAAEGPALAAAHARMLSAKTALALPGRVARLWTVTRGGVAAGPLRPLNPTEAAAWGLGRVLANEFPDIDVRLCDFAPEILAADLPARLAAEILSPAEDRETVHDLAGRAGVRAERVSDLADRARAATLANPAMGVRRLALGQQGSIDSLEWRVEDRGAPAEGEIEIEVVAAGLNFRDIMWAQGLLPEEALEDGFAGPTLGMECSGVVVRTGPACARFREGDRVIAFAPSCFATHVCVHENAVAPLPEGVDLTAAATIPTTFLTAWYGLVELSNLSSGETVLIHGGAGGVGLAALQIAAARGAQVIATAGSPAKRELLRQLGAAHVFDSRSLTFADDVMRVTDGEGVDVVLNSLFGEAMERSIECLKPFGRFVELGKRDYYANSQIGLRPFRRNLTYFGVDADQLLVYRPELAVRVFEQLGEGFERGDLIPLPHIVFDSAEVVDAFRLMQKSGHIGKILVKAPPKVEAPRTRAPRITGKGAYLVVGGLGGFGAETAAWLVERGARHIWLTSRSGRVTEAAKTAIRRMEAMGAKVVTRACDAADETAQKELIDEIEAGPARLRGVLHTAMTLDDALFANLDGERIRTVLRPKIAGAETLDRLTRDLKLDLFVVYSSATTLVGNPGQTAYVAANCYLEALMAERRRAGHPGLAVAWGAISDAGYLTRDAKTGAILSDRLGASAITAREAFQGLEMALAAADPQDASAVSYAQIDWASASRELAITRTPLFARMEMPDASAAGEAALDLAALVAGMTEAEALKKIAELLAGETSRILRLPAEEIDPRQPLTELGFDSLMAVDLRMAAEEKLGIDIPLMSLAGGATLIDIAARVLKRLDPAEAAAAGAPEDAVLDGLLERHVGTGDELDPEAIAELKRRAGGPAGALN
ncbi:SDR family NAD(P)-dependent oxidoreductase [uncultured Albimonas sp.]|uniref:SDR family NAD(P)-dependent oxidoreductase n=1 Tax=uncultured Albimonas sp. TaxID=1331701 RepID=UPI0030EEDF83